MKTRCIQYAKNKSQSGWEGLPHSVEIMRLYCGDEAALLGPAADSGAMSTPVRARSIASAANNNNSISMMVHPDESEVGSASKARKKRGRPRLSGEGAIQWTDEMTDKLVQLRYLTLAVPFGAPLFYCYACGCMHLLDFCYLLPFLRYGTFASEFDGSKSKYRLRDVWNSLASQLSDAFATKIESEQCRNKVSFVLLFALTSHSKYKSRSGFAAASFAFRSRR